METGDGALEKEKNEGNDEDPERERMGGVLGWTAISL